MISRTLTIAATLGLLAGCSANDTSPQSTASNQMSNRDCFFLSEVNGFSPAGPNQIQVNVGPNRNYLFKTFGSCPDLDFSTAIAFDQTVPGTICQGMDVDLIVPTAIGPQRCPVSMISRIPPSTPSKK